MIPKSPSFFSSRKLSHESRKLTQILFPVNSCKDSFPLTRFLKTFYNRSAFYFVSAGTIIKCKQPETETGSASVYYCKTQPWYIQLVFIVVQIWTALAHLFSEFHLSQNNVRNNPDGSHFRNEFRIFLDFFWVLMLLNIYRIFRKRSQGFCNILQKLDKIQRLFQESGIKLQKKCFIKGMSMVLLVLPFLWGCYSHFFINYEIQTKTITTILREQVYGSHIDLAKCTHQTCTDSFKNSTMSMGYKVLAAFVVAGRLGFEAATYFSHTTALVHTIVMYVLARDFINNLKRESHDNLERAFKQRLTVLKIFEEICGLSESIDDVIGSTVAFSCFDILTYFTSLIDDVPALGWAILVQVCLYGVIQGTFLILAGETNAKLGYLTFWLQNSREKRSAISSGFTSVKETWDAHERIWLALNQLQRNQIGIRGKAFTVTYGFVGNMLILLLSYSILMYQLQVT